MKFAEHLNAHITPEWRSQYIQYELMKEMLYDAQEQAPSADVTDASTIQRYFARFQEKFFQFSDKELAKINTFFLEKLSEANRKYAALKAELHVFLNHHQQHHERHAELRRRRSMANIQLFKDKKVKGQAVMSMRKLRDLKFSFSEFYLSLVLLQNYQTLNFTGFRKILKKHDKMMQTTHGAEWRQAHVETSSFYTNKEVDHLIKDVEQSVTNELEGGDRSRAMKRLRVPPLGDEEQPWTNFRMGLFIGMFIVLLAVIIISVNYIDRSKDWEPALQMYRGMFLVIFDLLLLSVNTYGWRSSGVNHVLIFEIDPRNHLSHCQLFELASCLGVFWASSVLLYLYSDFLMIPAMAMPLVFLVVLIIFLINPFNFFYYRARMWLLRILWRIVTAPYNHVGFADFWLADQLNSLVTVLLDFQFLVCYYAFEVEWHGDSRAHVCNKNIYGIRAIVSCLPAWWRFAQCLRRYMDTKRVKPHIWNAGKYSTTFFVVIFSTIYKIQVELYGEHYRQTHFCFYLWVASAVISSIYTYIWDIKMDWGLLDKNAGENKGLREEVVYPYKFYYYAAMVEDFILRFTWTLTVSVIEDQGHHYFSLILKTCLACLEVFRRFVWNFFRLENEHLNNCGQFRAVRDISIGPIDSNYEQQLLDIMDDEGTNLRVNDKRRRGLRSNKESRLFIEEDEERVPLVNGGKQAKRS
ncbi:xenotropic and polytropic retrovirus receptor 1 [Plakobranchus ocellatus]|uniref:Xenotropic and polytropic retrovirus receptor 1 n=1 Tax=Plakobranchus ocellatus TaxID=259542 RepID=A0AAV3Y690_9GAST|nr:xenotropic and polytropic retrovirus receptor 1 [Plakobranchus ocellatus]